MGRKGVSHNLKGSHWIRDKRRVRIYTRDRWLCVWCREPVRRGDRRGNARYPYRLATLDHIHYGDHASENLVTACKDCNARRGEQTIERFALSFDEPTIVYVRVLSAAQLPLPEVEL